MEKAPESGKERVIGVLVDKNPEIPLLKEAIQSYRGQIESLIIIDNSDQLEAKEAIKKIEAESGGFISVVWNTPEEDTGGGCFSQGSKIAIARGANWVITLLDDTVFHPNVVSTMLEAYHALPPETQKIIGIITPNMKSVRGLSFPEGDPVINDRGGTTEAQMIKASILPIIGYWYDDMRFDHIDTEFCLRVKKHGYKNLFVPRAITGVRWGHPDKKQFFGKTILIPNYAAWRYYYMSRNLVWMYVRNFRTYVWNNEYWRDAIWGVLIPRFFIKMVLFEKDRPAKIRACLHGWWDGLNGRLGPMPK